MKNLKRFFYPNKLLTYGIILLFVSFGLSVSLGSSKITLSELMGVLRGEEAYTPLKYIFLYVRLPRTLAAAFAGAGLAVSGAVLQSVLANRLASPGIIGVNAGAGLGVSLYSISGLASGVFLSLFAFGGSFLAVWLVAFAAMKLRASRSTVILGGVAVNAIFNAFSEAIAVIDNDTAMLGAEFKVGGFSSVSYGNLIPAIILISAALIIVFTLLNDLDVLSLGDETAAALGMKVRSVRLTFLILSALLAGASVSFSGLLGFVGLIVPNLIRLVCGSEAKKLIPLSALFGGVFVLLSDVLTRVLFSPFELPVGIIMAVTGGPFFIFILLKRKLQ